MRLFVDEEKAFSFFKDMALSLDGIGPAVKPEANVHIVNTAVKGQQLMANIFRAGKLDDAQRNDLRESPCYISISVARLASISYSCPYCVVDTRAESAEYCRR